MKISSFEKYLEDLHSRIGIDQWAEDCYNRRVLNEEKQKKREEIKQKFPYSVTVVGWYIHHDEVSSWLWKELGPSHGRCPQKDWEEEEFKCCPLEGKHSHIGNWTSFWLAKVGYDFGFADFNFKNEEDKDKFVKKIKEEYEPNHIPN